MGNCAGAPKKQEEKRTEKRDENKASSQAPVAASAGQSQSSQALLPEDVATLQTSRDAMSRGHEFNKKAHDAWESGDKAKAAELRDEGKKAFVESDQIQDRVSENQIKRAQASPTPAIDLHGYFLDAAMRCVEKAFAALKQSKHKDATIFVVIPGAGTHSDKNGPKIKPAVLEYFKKNNVNYTEATHGSYNVQL